MSAVVVAFRSAFTIAPMYGTFSALATFSAALVDDCEEPPDWPQPVRKSNATTGSRTMAFMCAMYLVNFKFQAYIRTTILPALRFSIGTGKCPCHYKKRAGQKCPAVISKNLK